MFGGGGEFTIADTTAELHFALVNGVRSCLFVCLPAVCLLSACCLRGIDQQRR